MVQNRPKNDRKRPQKWGQNDTKTSPKCCQDDAKMIPKWTQNDPDRPKNGSKMTRFWPILALFCAILTSFRLQKGPKKTVKKDQN